MQDGWADSKQSDSYMCQLCILHDSPSPLPPFIIKHLKRMLHLKLFSPWKPDKMSEIPKNIKS